MSSENLPFYCFFGFSIILVFVAVMHSKNVQHLLDFRAQENKYIILSKRRPFFARCPFWWSHGSQTVYRVEVQNVDGRIKTGWIRVTTFTWASGKPPCEAVWDEENR
jgi:hypothetical protein